MKKSPPPFKDDLEAWRCAMTFSARLGITYESEGGPRETVTLTKAQWDAVYDALGQYVENCTDADDLEAGSAPHLGPASEVLDRMNAVVAGLAASS